MPAKSTFTAEIDDTDYRSDPHGQNPEAVPALGAGVRPEHIENHGYHVGGKESEDGQGRRTSLHRYEQACAKKRNRFG